MVADAEKFKEEDAQAREKIEAKNGLENYAYSMRNTLEEEAIKTKMEAADRETCTKAIDEAILWLENNQLAEKEEFEFKQKELEGVCTPIISKLYQDAGGAGGMPGGMGGMPDMGGAGGGAPPAGAGPKIEEVD